MMGTSASLGRHLGVTLDVTWASLAASLAPPFEAWTRSACRLAIHAYRWQFQRGHAKLVTPRWSFDARHPRHPGDPVRRRRHEVVAGVAGKNAKAVRALDRDHDHLPAGARPG